MPDVIHQQPSPAELEDQAIEQWVHLTSGNASDTDRAKYQRWRTQSAAHEAAAELVEQMWQAVGQTRSATAMPAPRAAAPRRPRRWAALAACVAALAVVGLGEHGKVLLADQSTGTGERRMLTLEDGSQVWLNSASALSINYSAQRREITLIKGEALFEVGKDPARPFVVQASDGQVQAVGTRFDVDVRGRGVNVGVAEGIVQVSSGGQTVRLEHAQQLSYANGRAPSAISAYDAGSGAAWQRGKLIFNRAALEDVFNTAGRYLPGALVVAGQLPDTPVSGVFDLNDLPGMLDTLARTQPVRVVQLPWLTVVLNEKNKSAK